MAAITGNFRLGPDNGRVVLKTGRAGLASRAGHDLTIEVTRWSAEVQVPDEEAGGVRAVGAGRRRVGLYVVVRIGHNFRPAR